MSSTFEKQGSNYNVLQKWANNHQLDLHIEATSTSNEAYRSFTTLVDNATLNTCLFVQKREGDFGLMDLLRSTVKNEFAYVKKTRFNTMTGLRERNTMKYMCKVKFAATN